MNKNAFTNCPIGFAILTLTLLAQAPLQANEGSQVPDIVKKAPARIEKIEAPFEMPQLKRPVFKDQTFNKKSLHVKQGSIRGFGAYIPREAR